VNVKVWLPSGTSILMEAFAAVAGVCWRSEAVRSASTFFV
jgi:hypothetical protein